MDGLVPLSVTCPSCRLPIRLRARVLVEPDGGEVIVDTVPLRPAVLLHLRRCRGDADE